MRRVVLALLAVLPLACNKGPAPAGGAAAATAAPAAAPGYDLKRLDADLRSKSADRRQAAIHNAAVMDDDGEAVLPVLLAALGDPEAEALGTSTYTRPTSARETAVQALLGLHKDKGRKALNDGGWKALEAGLKDAKPTLREHTANAFGLAGPDAKPAADAVAKLCADKERDVRSAGYRALQKIQTFNPVPVLKLLGHSDLTIATDAATALTWMKPTGPAAAGELVAALKRPAKEKDNPADVQFVRAHAAEALGGIGAGAEAAVEPLVELLLKADAEEVERAVKAAKPGQKGTALSGPMLALRKIGRPAVEKLQPLLKHESPVVRYQAAAVLGGMGKAAEPALPDLQAALDVERGLPTGQMYVFEELIAATLGLGTDPGRVAGAVIELLKSDEAVVRYRAANLVARIGPKAAAAVPRLGELLDDENKQVQVAAINALAAVGPAAKEVVLELGKKVEGDDTAVARAAAVALRALGPAAAPAVPALAKALGSNDSTVSAEAALALAAVGAEAVAAVPGIVKQLEDKDARTEEKKAGLGALAAIGPPAKDAVPVVARLTADKDIGVRVAALEALGRVGAGNPDAVKKLAERVTDNQPGVQVAALKALGGMGPDARAAADAIKTLLARPTAVRVWAAAALCAIGVDADANAKLVLDALKDVAIGARVSRATAVEALPLLGARGTPGVPDLLAVLKEKPTGPAPRGDQMTPRELAARALGRLGAAEGEVIRALTEVLRDPAPGAKKAAADALGAIGPPALTALPRLRDLAEDSAVGPAARAAIVRIEGAKGE